MSSAVETSRGVISEAKAKAWQSRPVTVFVTASTPESRLFLRVGLRDFDVTFQRSNVNRGRASAIDYLVNPYSASR